VESERFIAGVNLIRNDHEVERIRDGFCEFLTDHEISRPDGVVDLVAQPPASSV
jgi:hypothetical protein